MTDQALQRAIDCLQIQDVWLHQSNAWMARWYDPKFPSTERFEVQYKHLLSGSYLMEVARHDVRYYVFRVFIDLGARLVPRREAKETEAGEEESEPLTQIEATFVAEYHTAEDPGAEALEAFAQRNASYHVWPYWREYLSSHSTRMSLPKITVPAIQFAYNRDDSC